MKYSGEFTCILARNLIGSDSPLMPAPVHIECWEQQGKLGGWTRKKGAVKFVVNGKWYSSLPVGTKCYMCHKVI